MEEKRIKITLESDGAIKIYNNEDLKKTIDKDCNEITGDDILDILNVEYGDVFSMCEIQEEDNNSRYKVYKMIYKLIDDIIEKLITNESDHIFDIDASEIEPIEE